ncbi:MAG TPA: GGDEF domain-containing protein [Bacillota bacterium]|nr:GGDEF domain-containing protein [Bacillota bacterium]
MFEPIVLMRCLIDGFVIILMCFVLLRNVADYGHQAKNLAFCNLCIAIIAELGLDIVCWLVDEIPGIPALRYINIAANILYIFNCGMVAYLWFYYVCIRIEKTDKHKITKILELSPLILLAVASVSSIWTKVVFYVDASNVYHGGKLFFFQLIVGLVYLLFSTIKVLKRIQTERQKYVRQELLTLLIYFVLNLSGGLLELLFPLYPFTWPVTALSLTMVYINLQSYQVSIDELTGLNNRRRFDYYMSSSLSNLSDNEKVYLLLGDINSFKMINDKFGHAEGDDALICIAKILKDVAGRYKAFAARYGGDEFAIVARGETYSDALKIQQDIHAELARQNDTSDRLYNLTLSIGIGEYSAQSQKSIIELIKEADDNLYIEKKKMKKER